MFEASRAVLDEQDARTLRAIVDYDEALMHCRAGDRNTAAGWRSGGGEFLGPENGGLASLHPTFARLGQLTADLLEPHRPSLPLSEFRLKLLDGMDAQAAEETGLEQLVNSEALERYVNAHVPGEPEKIDVRKHTAGYSNVTLFVTRGADEWVLRRPPTGSLLPTAHDVLREHRFISALYGKARVPRPILACEDPAIIGAPFYIMERVRGTEIRDEVPAIYDDPAGRRRMAEEMIDALVEVHAVDWQAAGLKAPSRGYLERTVDRWAKQWELTRARTRELPGLDRITEWLRQHMPPEGPSTVHHGDFKLDNVLFDLNQPSLLAILDWELATIGDPLADLGWLLSTWGAPGPDEPMQGSESAALAPVSSREGFPSTREMAELYSERSGRAIHDYNYYLVLAAYKGAVIAEGIHMRYIEGNVTNPLGARMEKMVPLRVERILALLDSPPA